MEKFLIDATDLCWIDGSADNADDLCLHGHAIVCIGNERLEFDATVSATALYLLKTLTEEHIIHEDNLVSVEFVPQVTKVRKYVR